MAVDIAENKFVVCPVVGFGRAHVVGRAVHGLAVLVVDKNPFVVVIAFASAVVLAQTIPFDPAGWEHAGYYVPGR